MSKQQVEMLQPYNPFDNPYDTIELRDLIRRGMVLYFVPPESMTTEICLEAVKGDCFEIIHVPAEHRTAEVCLEAVKGDASGKTLASVPAAHLAPELCLAAAKSKKR